MSRRSSMCDVVRGAAKWLPLLLGAMGTVTMAHAQTAGVAPLVNGDCTVTSAGVMTCAKTNGVAFAPSATTDATNASNVTSGTLSTARLPATGVGSSTVSNATVTYDNTGRITAISGVIRPSYTSAVFGDSYALGKGSTNARNGWGQLMKKDTPTMAGWLGNFAIDGGRSPVLAQTVLANAQFNATYPSTWFMDAGMNDAVACPAGTSKCVADTTRAVSAQVYWSAVPPQQRTLGTNMAKSGAWSANTTLAPVNGNTGAASGSAIQSSTNGDTLTITVPATNNGEFGLYVYVPTGTAGGTFTVTNAATGTNYTDACNGSSTTFNAVGCNGVTTTDNGPVRLRFATTAGVVNTVTVTHTNATALTVIAWDYTTQALAANTNAVIFGNGNAQIDANGWSATMAASVVSQARADGLISVMLADWRTASAAVADGTAGGTGTTFSPVYGAGSTFANHPRDYTYFLMEQASLQAQVASGYVVSALNAGLADAENGADTRMLQWTTPLNCTISPSWTNCYRNFNADNNYQSYGLAKWGNGTTGGYAERIGSGNYPDGTAGAYHASAIPSNARDCVQRFATANVTTESNFTNVLCTDPNGNSSQSGYNLATYNVRFAGTVIASAATIAPSAGITHVSGAAAITTITPPAGCSLTGKGCDVTFVPDGAWSLATGGNIAQASTAVVNRPMVLTWVNADAKWYPSY